MRDAYKIAKANKVGELTVCPSCGELFIKVTKAQAFCKNQGGTVCKDKYWNTVDPRKRNNTTRISPANARYMEKMAERRIDRECDDHPFSCEGLGQWID